jgi:hypothetical protein
MPFDAGSIQGKLDLNITSFKDGFNEAHTHAETEGGKIREVVESIAAVFEKSLGPAIGGVASDLTQMAAGFSEGPVIGALGVMATAVGAVRENTEGVLDDWEEMGQSATTLGVPVEYLSRLSDIARTVNVDSGQLTNSLMMLNFHIGQIADGADKKGAAAFGRLGISMDDLKKHANDTQWTVDAITTGINKLPDIGQKTAVLRDLMGRGGGALLKFFELAPEKMKDMGDSAQTSGAVITAAMVHSAEDVKELTTKVGYLMDGLRIQIAIPFVDYLVSHAPQIEKSLTAVAGSIRKEIPEAFKYAQEKWDELKNDIVQGVAGKGPLAPFIEDVKELGASLKEIASDIKWLATKSGEVKAAGEEIKRYATSGDDGPVPDFKAPDVGPGEKWHHSRPDFDAPAPSHPSGTAAHSPEVDHVIGSAMQSGGAGNASRTGGSGSSNASAPAIVQTYTVNVNAPFDVNAATSQIAAKILPKLQAAYQQSKQALEGAAMEALLAKSIGGLL